MHLLWHLLRILQVTLLHREGNAIVHLGPVWLGWQVWRGRHGRNLLTELCLLAAWLLFGIVLIWLAHGGWAMVRFAC